MKKLTATLLAFVLILVQVPAALAVDDTNSNEPENLVTFYECNYTEMVTNNGISYPKVNVDTGDVPAEKQHVLYLHFDNEEFFNEMQELTVSFPCYNNPENKEIVTYKLSNDFFKNANETVSYGLQLGREEVEALIATHFGGRWNYFLDSSHSIQQRIMQGPVETVLGVPQLIKVIIDCGGGKALVAIIGETVLTGAMVIVLGAIVIEIIKDAQSGELYIHWAEKNLDSSNGD